MITAYWVFDGHMQKLDVASDWIVPRGATGLHIIRIEADPKDWSAYTVPLSPAAEGWNMPKPPNIA